ncbi:MAG: DUF805 domain-containing protein [Sedimentisphaerales bacterium]
MDKASIGDRLRNKVGLVDVILTGLLSISLLTISWLLDIWFTHTMADESVVFGSLGFLLVLSVTPFVVFEWWRHDSIWISLVQGAVLSAFAARPIFSGEPDMKSIIGPAIISVFGGLYAAIVTGICWLARYSLRPRRTEVSAISSIPAPRSTTDILFSFRGRISRSTYIKFWAILTGFVIFLGVVPDIVISGEPGVFYIITSLALTWPGLAIYAKRIHDRDRSPWLLLLTFIPFLGIIPGIWILVEVFFLKGTDGDNQYGADPLQSQAV